MRDQRSGDVLRSVSLAAAAVFMLAANGPFGPGIEDVGDMSMRTVIDPARYAFFIWFFIFLMGLVTAVYQAVRQNRHRPLMRSVGWLLAAEFALTGLWPFIVVAGWANLANITLLAMGALLAVAYLRIAGSQDFRPSDSWGVMIPVSFPLGWLTAANAVSLATRGLDSGILAAGTAANLISALMLIAAGVVAGWLILRGRSGPTALWIGYAAAIAWGIVAIVIEQWGMAPVGVAAALAAAVLAALIGWRGRERPFSAGQRA